MSLLNNVLRDLQGRGAFGLPPLTGLEPVSEIPDQHRKRVLLLPALAVLTIASAVLVWQPMGDDRGILSLANIMTDTAPQPTYGPQSDAMISPQAEPAIAATGADLRDISNIDSTAIASTAGVGGNRRLGVGRAAACGRITASGDITASNRITVGDRTIASDRISASRSNAGVAADSSSEGIATSRNS
jgi:hypothetical protein